ncbi:MAG: peptidoglycan editing factor PgeF [Nitrospirota bacterium]
MNTPDGSQYLIISALEQTEVIHHAFTTRRNGLGARKNGVKATDDWNVIAKDFGIANDRLVTVEQIHGETIVTADERNYQTMKSVQADAMITNIPGIAIGVETADCVPVLLVDPALRAIAAIHAGWKSTVLNIVGKTVYRMQDTFGSDPSTIIAGIGPAIGPECYEVDEPVMTKVKQAFPFWDQIATEHGNGRWHLDLVKTTMKELAQTGIQEWNIHTIGLCTSCRRDLFYSFRAEGRTGRMLSVIMLNVS